MVARPRKEEKTAKEKRKKRWLVVKAELGGATVLLGQEKRKAEQRERGAADLELDGGSRSEKPRSWQWR